MTLPRTPPALTGNDARNVMELDITKDITIEPLSGGGFLVRQYSREGKRDFQRAFTDQVDLLEFLEAALDRSK